MAARKKPGDASPFVPAGASLPELGRAVQQCEGCDLHLAATRAVFGEGSEQARVVFVGEQPGDSEDRQGRPFVGPAGGVLDRALAQAGVARAESYVTNAVKHFSFEPRGKARLHKRPRVGEVRACAPWLRAELNLIRPEVLVLLGSTAAQSVLGPGFRITKQRGLVEAPGQMSAIVATIHPSAVLRAPDHAAREELFAGLVQDLEIVAQLLRRPRARR